MTGRKEPRRPRIRRTWTRNPSQRTHSTPKGAKGYARTRTREVLHEEIRVSVGKKLHKPLRIVVLLSGKGRQLHSIFSHLDNKVLEGEIVAVISDNADADGLTAARERGIKTVILDPARFVDAEAFSKELNENLDEFNPGVVLLDGFAGPAKLREKRNRHVTHRAEALLEIAAID